MDHIWGFKSNCHASWTLTGYTNKIHAFCVRGTVGKGANIQLSEKLETGSKNFTEETLDDEEQILLPLLHIKLDLITHEGSRQRWSAVKDFLDYF